MNRLSFFFNKIPRTRIYIRPKILFHSLFETLFKRPESGAPVKEFEKAFGRYYGSKHVRALPFARIAFYYILKALDLKTDSEVLLTPITIPDMVNMIRCSGLKPVFVDIIKDTYNIDCDDLEKKINEKSKVLLITYLCGLVPDMEEITTIAKRHGLILIEDCSQNFGATYKNKPLGTFGEVGFFSTGILKAVSTYSGGIIISDNERLLHAIDGLTHKDFTSPPKRFLIKFILENLLVWFFTQRFIFSLFTYYIIKFLNLINPEAISKSQTRNVSLFFGGQPCLLDTIPKDTLYFYTDIQAKVGLQMLQTVTFSNEQRIQNASILLENLPTASNTYFPRLIDETKNVFWRFPIHIKDYQGFQKYLFEKYIDTSRTNLMCCSSAPFFTMYAAKTRVAEELKEHTVYIPVDPSLSNRQMIYIADTIGEYFQKHENSNRPQDSDMNK